jgi:hypothetical protein
LFRHRSTLYFLSLQRFHRRLEVVAHEVQFVHIVLFGRMKRSFRRRQRKDEPAVTGVHRAKFEDIAEEGAVRLRVLAVNDDVGSGDHRSSLVLA